MSALRTAAGYTAVTVLTVFARLPLRASNALGETLLPAYALLRMRTRKVLSALGRCGIRVSPLAYYRMRLRLALLSLRHNSNLNDGCTHHVQGRDLFEAALATGRPVVLLGWHQGPVELLHRIPAEDLKRIDQGAGRTVTLMTASAFSPVLADWMASGRAGDLTRVIRPGDTQGLRAWARESGVLAVMVDQVPATPDAWISLWNDTIHMPWPRRLMAWLCLQNPVFLTVSTRWRRGRHIIFEYEALSRIPERGTNLTDGREPITEHDIKHGVTMGMARALAQAPEQYNWSYRKIRVCDGAQT
jgi:lauroyl/myristoyl acyltransferase